MTQRRCASGWFLASAIRGEIRKKDVFHEHPISGGSCCWRAGFVSLHGGNSSS